MSNLDNDFGRKFLEDVSSGVKPVLPKPFPFRPSKAARDILPKECPCASCTTLAVIELDPKAMLKPGQVPTIGMPTPIGLGCPSFPGAPIQAIRTCSKHEAT